MKKILAILLCIPALAVLTQCRSGDDGSFDIAVVTDAGGLGDKGKNDMVWRGCQRFVEESGIPAKTSSFEPDRLDQGRTFIRDAGEAGADVIVVASPLWEDYVHELAAKHADVSYLVLSGERGADNVKALRFPARDAGYLMGVAAAAAVPTGHYAFLGGRKDRVTDELAAGYGDGVRSENPSSSVEFVYMGEDFASSVDEGRARRMADKLYEGGADVIFAAAGWANAEIAAVAKEHQKLVIGYESNQNYLERGYVITSLNIRWDDVIFEELCAAGRGAFTGGVREFDIASEHICYPIDDNNRALIPAEAIRKIEAARQHLAAGPADDEKV
ncbi:MAG: BMP family ABC transporter substrate-binding protein [Candidatus Zixiibacteriota bacterium]